MGGGAHSYLKNFASEETSSVPVSANVDTPMEHSGCPRWYINVFSSQLTSNSRYPAYNKLVANWVRNGKSNWSMDEVDSDRKPKQYSKTSSRTWCHLCVAVPAFVCCILEEIPSGLICHVFWWQNLADGWLTVLSNWLKVWSLKSKHKAIIVSFNICLLRRSLESMMLIFHLLPFGPQFFLTAAKPS